MIPALFAVAQYLLSILTVFIIVQVIVSLLVSFQVINLQQPFVRAIYTALERLTEPLYRPFRRILPDLGGIDLSPLLVLILIRILGMLLAGAKADLMAV